MSPLVSHRCLGTFVIPFDLINTYPEQAHAILFQCIVLGAVRSNRLQHVSYLAIHKDFVEVPFGSNYIPYYEYTVRTDSGRDLRTWVPSEQPRTVPADRGIE